MQSIYEFLINKKIITDKITEHDIIECQQWLDKFIEVRGNAYDISPKIGKECDIIPNTDTAFDGGLYFRNNAASELINTIPNKLRFTRDADLYDYAITKSFFKLGIFSSFESKRLPYSFGNVSTVEYDCEFIKDGILPKIDLSVRSSVSISNFSKLKGIKKPVYITCTNKITTGAYTGNNNYFTFDPKFGRRNEHQLNIDIEDLKNLNLTNINKINLSPGDTVKALYDKYIKLEKKCQKKQLNYNDPEKWKEINEYFDDLFAGCNDLTTINFNDRLNAKLTRYPDNPLHWRLTSSRRK